MIRADFVKIRSGLDESTDRVQTALTRRIHQRSELTFGVVALIQGKLGFVRFLFFAFVGIGIFGRIFSRLYRWIRGRRRLCNLLPAPSTVSPGGLSLLLSAPSALALLLLLLELLLPSPPSALWRREFLVHLIHVRPMLEQYADHIRPVEGGREDQRGLSPAVLGGIDSCAGRDEEFDNFGLTGTGRHHQRRDTAKRRSGSRLRLRRAGH